VVVSDIHLPDLSGDELVTRLRAKESTTRARMIALSGSREPEVVERALGAGFDRYLVKPVAGEELREILAE
jgi:CheY-like chemotaxis protein